jgi:putative ABC transport system permease protein
MALWRFSLREVQQRPARSLFTLLSVAIGVAVIVSVSLSSTSARQAYRELYEALAGRAALEVVAQGGGTFAESVAERLAQTPGVRGAVPLVQRPGLIYVRHRRFQVMVLGVDPLKDRLARDNVLESGEYFPEGNTAMLPAGFAAAIGVAVGDEVNILTRRGIRTLRIAGLLRPSGAAAVAGGSTLFLRLDKAQQLLTAPGQIDTVDLVLDGDAAEPAVEAELQRRLPPGLVVQRPAARTDVSRETLLSMEMGMSFAAALSLFASALIVLNALLMNVSERRRQLGILRSVGATRRQVTTLILREGLILGVAGTVLGVGIGWGGAQLLTWGIGHLLQVRLPGPQLTAQAIAMSLLIGPGVSLLAAYLPARQAARVSPLEAMRAACPADSEPSHSWPTWLGLTLLATFALVAVLYAWGIIPLQAGTPLTAIGLAGCVLLMPAAVGLVSNGVAEAFYRLVGFEGELAARQLPRRRLRTSLTAGVLFVALVLGIGLGSALLSNIEDIRQWYQRVIAGDYFLRATMPDMGTGLAADMPEGLAEDIQRIPGIVDIETACFFRATAQGRPVIVVARSFAKGRQLPLDLEQGDPRRLPEQLERGEVVVGTVLARRAGLRPGDWLTVDTREGARQMRVAGTTNDYTVGGAVIFVDMPTARRLFHVRGVDVFLIRAAPGQKAAVGAALRLLAERHGLLLQSFEQLSRMIDGMIAGVVAGIWVLLAAGFVIASFGIANTLTMNILEQTRELGLLRAVGMTRRQLYKMVFSQAAAIALVSLVPGAVVGLAMAYLFNTAAAPVLGHSIPFRLHPWLVAGCLAAALAIVMAAAWAPSRRAAGLAVAEALQYE